MTKTGKPKCTDGTPCGSTCISERYSCTSIVQQNGLELYAKQPLMSKWAGSFDGAPADVQRTIHRLPDPMDLSDGRQGKTCYSEGNGIYMGSQTSPSSTYDQHVFRHEYGHYVDKQLSTAKRHRDFELATGGSTVADIEYYANKYGTGIGKQLDKTADSLGFDKVVMFDLYVAATASTVEYVSTTPELHDAMRRDEASVLSSAEAVSDSKRSAIRMSVAQSLLPERIRDTATSLADQDTLPGHLVRSAIEQGYNIDSRFMLAVLSQDVQRLAVEADRLLGSEVLVQDLLGSLTANKVGRGHSDEYYAKGPQYQQRNTETFANLFSLHASGNKLAESAAKTFAPESYKALLKVLSHD